MCTTMRTNLMCTNMYTNRKTPRQLLGTHDFTSNLLLPMAHTTIFLDVQFPPQVIQRISAPTFRVWSTRLLAFQPALPATGTRAQMGWCRFGLQFFLLAVVFQVRIRRKCSVY